MKNKALSFYTGVFLVSGLVMALQILQSRLFSVTSWYHLSFLVISMAMFGLTLGALKIYKSPEEEQRRDYGLIARKHSVMFGVFIIIALFSQLFIPIFSNDYLLTALTLPIAAVLTSIAYYHAGIVITVSLTRAPFPVGTTYGVDLVGAGLGCIVALVLMETIDTPSALLLVASVAFVSALAFPVSDKARDVLCIARKNVSLKACALCLFAALFCAGVLNTSLSTPLLYPLWVKDRFIPISQIEYEEWNSISRVTVSDESLREPFAWGPSPIFPKDQKIWHKFLVIDGDAGTPLTKFDGDFSKHSYLEYDVTNVAYTLPDVKRAVIIGVGGGRDLMSAKYFGVEEVTALDVNPVQIKLLTENEEYRSYTQLYNQPGVQILNEEARSWFRQNDKKYDLVQMSLIDTWAATGAGAFALSENGLYTTEAWGVFMNDLSDHGVFTLSRWSANAVDDTGRSLSVAMATLFNQGVENPRDHIVMVNSGVIVTLVISKSPFTDAQLAVIEKTAADKQYKIILIPNKAPPEGLLSELISADSIAAIKAISDEQFFDVSPSTDMRPFFFNQARLTAPIAVSKMVLGSDPMHQTARGQVKATFNLFLIILFSALMVAFVIIRPLLKTVEDRGNIFIRAGTLYFVLIGLGFMFMEISLLQALGVFLGHPIYGLSVVLFSLIISAGLGSFASGKFPLTSLPRQLTWCLLTCAYGVVMSNILGDVFHAYAEVEIMTRVLISVAVMAPVGFLMGFGFPTGLMLTERFDARATAWFWGINGAAGVLGSSLAIAMNISLGIDNTLIVAGSCYALLSVSFLIFTRLPAK